MIYFLTTDGAVYLFVVNHPQGNSQVEIFRFVEKENALQYIKTIKHELMHKYVLISVYFKYFCNSKPDQKLNSSLFMCIC